MTYTAAALLGAAAALAVDLAVLRTALVRRAVFWATYPIVVFFQLLSNGVLTGREIVRYDPDAIIGVRLAHAPVEDLLFGFALVLLTLSVWVRLGRGGVQRTPAAGRGSPLLRYLRQRDRIGRLARQAVTHPHPDRTGCIADGLPRGPVADSGGLPRGPVAR